jgi:hypothetical protein
MSKALRLGAPVHRRRVAATVTAAALVTIVLACTRADGAASHVIIDPGPTAGAPIRAVDEGSAGPAAATAVATAAAEPAQPTPPSSPAAGGAPLDPYDAALAFARCIRSNGYPEWPDPNADGQFMMIRSAGMSFSDPRRIAAMEACQALRPAGLGMPGGADPAVTDVLLEVARCMRANGVVDFPDPAPGGGAFILGPGQGVDVQSATFRNALAICGSRLAPGGMLR